MSASGWFTSVGHKGCSAHAKGCTCTDTMKCNEGIHPEWWPIPGKGECRPDLSSYGSDFYPTTNCSGVVGNDPGANTYGGPPGRFGTGSPKGCTSCKGDFYSYYGPQNKAYANFPKRHCSSTCDCTTCANMPISSNCQGKDSKDGHPCDCSFGNMKHGCWDDNCTGGNSTCDCTRCANTPIGSRCKGVDSKIPGFACECGLPDKNVCWNYNCCPQGTKAPGPNDAGPIAGGGMPAPSHPGSGSGSVNPPYHMTPSGNPTYAPLIPAGESELLIVGGFIVVALFVSSFFGK